MATIHIDPSAGPKNPPQIEPEETYYGSFRDSHPAVQLRIATGGAGQSGFIKALADAFIDAQAKQTGCAPFAVAWLKSDTAGSFNYLAQGSADLSITYHPAAEAIAIAQGFAERSIYAWRDHFMLVGPSSNPAHLSPNPTATIHTLFAQLFRGAVANPSAVRFLSRYDKSATNIKESLIWTSIGQCPWVDPDSADLYHRYPAFPFQALEMAARLGEYTLVDRGTWWGVEGWVREGMVVFKEGHDSDPDPILLNPAHALVGTWGKYKNTANAFADWMDREDGGQKVVNGFMVNGVVLYTKAPGAVDLYWLNSPSSLAEMQRTSAPFLASAWDMSRKALIQNPLIVPRPFPLFLDHFYYSRTTPTIAGPPGYAVLDNSHSKTSIETADPRNPTQKRTDFARRWVS